VLHSTHERSLGKLGGLMRFMPWVGWATLVGVVACAGLPPSNGFASEWLLLQGFLFTGGLPNPYLKMLVPIFAAGLVLVAALAAYVMVKFFGVIFLGRPRDEKIAEARDAGAMERMGLMWLVAGCVLLGLFPVAVIGLIDPIPFALVGRGLALSDRAGTWLLLAPVSAERAAYSPIVVLLVGLALIGGTFVAVRRLYHGRIRRANPWDCGFPAQNARMQDTAEGFGQPIRQIFEPFYRMERHLPTAFDAKPRYQVVVEDPLWRGLYLRIASVTDEVSRQVGKLQRGRIAIYLLYSFVTLVALLFLGQA
jgi:NADH:ubiquinone oxidoreductase subunit 5 (subunit L)/multisubunit Na+/H+ antiporter MnhA subunit